VTQFGWRGGCLSYNEPGKKVPEHCSGLHPSETELPEQCSGAFHHKITPGQQQHIMGTISPILVQKKVNYNYPFP
jgi:hypothetical protein